MLEARMPRLMSFLRVGAARFMGHVAAADDPGHRFMVDIFVDECRVATVAADRFDPTLAGAGIGDGCHAFLCDLDADLLDRATSVIARICNTDTPIGDPIEVAHDPADPTIADRRRAGRVEWQGGLKIAGLALERAPPAAPAVLRIEVDDALTLTLKPRRWQSRSVLREEADQIPFDLTLPDGYADGLPHRVRVLDESGADLEGSPLVILAEPAARVAHLAAGPIPFSSGSVWPSGTLVEADGADLPAVRIVLVGEDEADASIQSLEGDVTTWSLVTVPVDAAGRFDPDALRHAAQADIEDERFAVFARSGVRFRPQGLARLIAPLNRPDVALSYGDVLFDLGDDRIYPGLCSAFDRVRAEEQDYLSHVFAVDLAKLDLIASKGVRSLFAAALVASGEGRAVHVPGPLAHVRRLDAAAEAARQAEDLEDFGLRAEVLATSLLPTVRLRPALASDATVAVIVHGGREDAAQAMQDRFDAEKHSPALSVRFHAARRATAALLNEAAGAAGDADMLLFVHADLKGLAPEVLAELVARLNHSFVAAVAPVIEAEDGAIARAGWTCGPDLTLVDRCAGWPADHPGFADGLRAAHRVLAADASALLVRRDAFAAAGGFDASHFSTTLFAEDLCLRLQAQGKAVVITPHARLRGRLPGFRAFSDGPRVDLAEARARSSFRNRWAAALVSDPFYNPLLNRRGPPFSGISAEPTGLEAREPIVPAPWPGLDGAGTVAPANANSRAISR